jgi:hypothetical protein
VSQLVEGLDFSVRHSESGVGGVGRANGVERPALDDEVSLLVSSDPLVEDRCPFELSARLF